MIALTTNTDSEVEIVTCTALFEGGTDASLLY